MFRAWGAQCVSVVEVLIPEVIHVRLMADGWFNQVLEGSIKSIQKIIWLQTARVQPAKDMFISGRGDGTAPGADWVDTLRLVDSVAFDRDFP
jgi:hypothetical protein